MTQVELNSSELNLIIPALKMDRQRILERVGIKKTTTNNRRYARRDSISY